MLIIGGSGREVTAQTVHLLDLRTGSTCLFKDLPGSFSVNCGEGVFINGKVIACGKDGCVTWKGNKWLKNEPAKPPFKLDEDAALLLPDNRWLLGTHHVLGCSFRLFLFSVLLPLRSYFVKVCA
jgi:hypothetical protein